MSFRTRLTSFFLLIVVVPMGAVGVLVFRLIGDSEQGKADARANGLATVAASLYASERASATTDAATIARNPDFLRGRGLHARLASFAAQAGIVRITLVSGPRLLADVGDRAAVAPGSATATGVGRSPITVRVSTVTASDFAHDLGAPRASRSSCVRVVGFSDPLTPSRPTRRFRGGGPSRSVAASTAR